MLKAFSILWLVVFVPLFILIFPSPISPVAMFNEYAEKTRYIDTYAGTFYLLEKQLGTLPPEAWQEHVRGLDKHFGYDLTLLAHDQVNLGEEIDEVLRAGEFAFVNGEPEQLLKRVGNSTWVLALSVDITPQEDRTRASSGAAYLMREHFLETPRSQWSQTLKALSEGSKMDLALVPMDRVPLGEPSLSKLNNNQLVWQKGKNAREIFYQNIDGETILSARVNTSSVSPMLILIILFMFVFCISVGMLLWVSPVWRDINKLTSTAADFGDGHLDSRAHTSPRSVMHNLGKSFNQMADSIEKLISTQKELTNAISHDLRTPLYRMRFAFEMLDDEGLTDAENAKYKASIRASIDDLDHLISQTLLLARYSRNADITHFSPSNIYAVATEEVSHFQMQYAHLNIELVVNQTSVSTTTIADERAIRRVLSNLLSNAARFADSRVTVTIALAHQSAEISVEDDGPGIDEQNIEKILQPFVQLDNVPRQAASGHGLGLAIVQQIAQWHKGALRVERSALGGAKFVFIWPSARH